MKVVIVGASRIGIAAARSLIEAGHRVVVIERDAGRIDELSDQLDCGLIHGDGTSPSIMREAIGHGADATVSATDDDRVNVLASVVARHIGVPATITTVRDRDLEEVCNELGLHQVVAPSRTMARMIVELVHGHLQADPAELLRHGARLACFTLERAGVATVSALGLPAGSRALWGYRKKAILELGAETALEGGDEVVVLEHGADHAAIAACFTAPEAPAGT